MTKLDLPIVGATHGVILSARLLFEFRPIRIGNIMFKNLILKLGIIEEKLRRKTKFNYSYNRYSNAQMLQMKI